MTIATIFFVVIVNIRAGYAFDGFTNGLFSFTYQQMEVVELRSTSFAPRQIEQARLRSVWRRLRHQAICIEGAVGATGISVIIVLGAHAVEGVDELIVVLCIAEYLLMIDTSHHNVEDTGS